MRRKQIEQRASVLNAAGAKKGAFAVVASKTPALDRSQEIATFKCGSCTTVFASNVEEPFCPNCGSMHAKAHVAKAEKVPAEAELSAIVCKGCGTHNILADATASALKGQIHCATCGSEVKYVTADTSPDDVEKQYKDDALDDGRSPDDAPITNADKDQVLEIEKEKKEPPARKEGATAKSGKKPVKADTSPDSVDKQYKDDALDDGRSPDDSPITNADKGDIEEIVKEKMGPGPTVMSKAKEEAQEDSADPMVEPIADDALMDEAPVSAEGDDVMGDEQMDVEEVDEEDEGEGVPAKVSCSMLATVLSTAKKPKLTLAWAEDNILALVNGIHVANLPKDKAGENAEVFHSEAFAQAILHAAEGHGIKQSLAHFNFQPITVQFPQSKAVKAMVSKRVAEAAKKFGEQSKTLEQDFLQCMSIAATGLNRGFFRDKENALKAAFYDTLTTAGLKAAERIIDPVFAKNGDVYHKTLIELATELMKKPVDVRNALAEAIGETKYQEVTAEGDQDQDEDEQQMGDEEEGCGPGMASYSRIDDLGRHLESAAATPVTSKRITKLKPGVKPGSIREIASAVTGNGSKPLFNRVRSY